MQLLLINIKYKVLSAIKMPHSCRNEGYMQPLCSASRDSVTPLRGQKFKLRSEGMILCMRYSTNFPVDLFFV